VQRMTTLLSSASSPPFFQISNSLQLPPYPLNRHVALFPPCVTAQVCPSASSFNIHLHLCSSCTSDIYSQYFLHFVFNALLRKPAMRPGQSQRHLFSRFDHFPPISQNS
jgi:hypothetical protein